MHILRQDIICRTEKHSDSTGRKDSRAVGQGNDKAKAAAGAAEVEVEDGASADDRVTEIRQRKIFKDDNNVAVVGTRLSNTFPGCPGVYWGTFSHVKLANDSKSSLYCVEYDDGDVLYYSKEEITVCFQRTSLLPNRHIACILSNELFCSMISSAENIGCVHRKDCEGRRQEKISAARSRTGRGRK